MLQQWNKKFLLGSFNVIINKNSLQCRLFLNYLYIFAITSYDFIIDDIIIQSKLELPWKIFITS